MSFARKKLWFVVVAFLVLTIGLGGYLFLNSNLWNQEHNNQGYLLSSSAYPQLKLEFDHPQLQPTTGKTLQASFITLLDELGYGVDWQNFHYGPYKPSAEYSTQPQLLTIWVLPIKQYRSSQHGPLFNVSADAQGNYMSGYNCAIPDNPEQLVCHLFLNDSFFAPHNPESAQRFLINFLASSLLMMGNTSTDNQTIESLFIKLDELYQQDQLQLSQTSSHSSLTQQVKTVIASLLESLNSKVYAQECSGNLYCRSKVNNCVCNDGVTVCSKDSICAGPPQHQCTDCTTTCEGEVWFSPQQNCGGLSDYPWCVVDPNLNCQGGETLCEGPALGSCYAGGAPPPPPPTPPPAPGCSGVCCAAGQTCNGEIAGGVCPEGYTCCNSCSTPDPGEEWPPYGVYRVWLFHDFDESTTLNSEDQQLPADVLANTTVVAQTTGGGYSSNTADSGLSEVWASFQSDNCVGNTDGFNGCGESNGVCCDQFPPLDFCFGYCMGSCSGSDSSPTANCGSSLGEQSTFFSSFLWNYYNPDKFNSFDIDFAIGPEGSYVYYTTGIQFAINPPEGWKVTTLRHRSARGDDSPLKTYTTGTNIIGGTIRSRNTAADRLKNQTSLLAVGLAEVHNPPVVLQSQISQINGESVAPVNNTYQICHPSSATTRLNLLSVYSDEDEIYHQENRVENGGFEAGLTGWETSGTGMGTIETSSDSHTGDNALLVQSTWTFGGGSGERRAIQWVDLNPNTDYSFTASYKGGGEDAEFKIHLWCIGASNYGAGGSRDFSEYHDSYQTINYSFNRPPCNSGYSLRAAIHTDVTDGAQILIDSILLRENSSSVGPYNDIRNIQLNLENNPYTNPGDSFISNNWPLRVMFNRLTHDDTPQDHYKIQHQPNMNNASSLMQFENNIWYLSEDLEILNSSNQAVANLISSDPINDEFNTYFSIPSYDTRVIETRWVVDLHPNFPPGLYNLTSFTSDFRSLQDSRDYSAFSNRSNLTLDYEGSAVYFHRFAQVNIFNPNLDINFIEWEDGDDSTGDYCPYREGGSTITLSSGEIEIKPHGAPESDFVSANINNQSSITINASACADSYDIRLTLNQADGYACNCQATGNSNLECYYTGIPASYLDGEDPINFYLTSVDLTNDAWFQAIGGQIVAQGNINSYIPFNDATGPCISENNCLPGLITHQPWTISGINEDTPGFPLSSSGNINTHDNGGVALIHIDEQRTQSVDGHAIDDTSLPNQYGYDFFYNKFGIDYASDSGNHLSSSDQPTLSSGLNIRFAPEGETFEINSSWHIENGQQLIVFVDGNLQVSDAVGESRVIRTDLGGYLAFIVSGNIIFDESVGYNNPGNIPVAFSLPNTTLPNVEGIFIADGQLRVNSDSNSATSDRKFIGAGTFVGWSGVNLDRSFNDGVFGNAWHNYNPTETFIYRPDFLLNTPMVMKQSIHQWREAPPKSINN